MTQNVLIRQCPAGVSEEITAYWEQKRPRIERLLQRIPEDQRELRFNLDCEKDGYDAWAVLRLPTGTLVVRTKSPAPDARAAVDQVVDTLVADIRRHKERVRHDDVYRRKNRRESDFNAIEPRLSNLRDKDDRKQFFELLRPHLWHLRGHARRELVIAQLEGNIRPGEMTVQDLLDEVIVRAWDGWKTRPRNQPLDRWLVGLLHEILDEKGFTPPDEKGKPKVQPPPEAIAERNAVSVYDRVREDDPKYEAEDGDVMEANPDFPFAAENEWAAENNPYWPFLNPLTRDEAIPDEHTAEPWQELADDEMRRRVFDELKTLPRDQRRAFTLHALDGWTIKEIAEAQHRSPDEVRADIEAVRATLRQRLQNVVAT